MPAKRLLLVLGAGASRPYMLPTSDELRHIILGNSHGDDALKKLEITPRDVCEFIGALRLDDFMDHEHLISLHTDERYNDNEWSMASPSRDLIRAIVTNYATEWNTTNEFFEQFEASDQISIDAFIKKSEKRLSAAARHAVAAVLLLTERHSLLCGDWYQHLLEKLLARFDKLEDEEVSVVTFNYDRTLETYLQRCETPYLLGNGPRAKEALQRIPIVHVYGSLDGPSTAPSPIPFAGRDVVQAADGIDLAFDRTPRQKRVQELIAKADRIVFIGFGFWPENMEVLDLGANVSPACKLMASAYRLPPSTVRRMETQFGIRFGSTDEKACDFVINQGVFAMG